MTDFLKTFLMVMASFFIIIGFYSMFSGESVSDILKEDESTKIHAAETFKNAIDILNDSNLMIIMVPMFLFFTLPIMLKIMIQLIKN